MITYRAVVLETVQYCTFGLFDDDCIEEAFPSDCCHNVFGQFSQLAPQQLSHPLSILCQLLLLHHLQIEESLVFKKRTHNIVDQSDMLNTRQLNIR